MPFYTKKDFAAACGIPTKTLAVYILRGKVIMSGEVIDDSITENKLFLASPPVKKNGEVSQAGPISPSAPIIDLPNRNNIAPKIDRPENSSGLGGLIIQQKELDIEKTGEEITKLKLTNQKLQGDNIPTDLVKGVMNRHNKSLMANFKVGIDNLIIEIEKMAGLTRTQIATLRGDMIGILNTSMDGAIAESKSEIHNIIKEVSVKRRVGEHD